MSTQIPLIQREPRFVKHWETDVCESRHKGNPASVAAHEKVLPYKTEQQQQAYEMLFRKGDYGVTSKELKAETGMEYTSASARLSEAVRDGWAYDSTDPKRLGCTVRKLKFAVEA